MLKQKMLEMLMNVDGYKPTKTTEVFTINLLKFRDSEKSRIFVKITKTKVLAAFGQLVDVIFGTGKFPIGISETKIPEGETDYAHLDTSNPTPV